MSEYFSGNMFCLKIFKYRLLLNFYFVILKMIVPVKPTTLILEFLILKCLKKKFFFNNGNSF